MKKRAFTSEQGDIGITDRKEAMSRFRRGQIYQLNGILFFIRKKTKKALTLQPLTLEQAERLKKEKEAKQKG